MSPSKESCDICSIHGGHSELSYEVRIALIQEWLKNCLQNHPNSRRPACSWPDADPPLPTRVLQLELGDGTRDIRLVEGDERDEKLKYAALTYRWGRKSKNSFKTVSDTLHENQSRIKFKSLDVLFRDTIRLLRSLGIPYLWIDRFCIVQDDVADWEREASKMADVYSNAHLTISASVATSPTTRLFPHIWDYTPPHDFNSGSVFDSETVDGTLSHRGWCVQERCLSRRILHFGRGQLHWECPTDRYSEHSVGNTDGTIKITRTILGPQPFVFNQPNSNPYPFWYEIMHNYTAGLFTVENDRESGLLGLRSVFERITGDRMVWGLWMDDLAYGLLWRLDEFAISKDIEDEQSWPKRKWRPGTLGAPSWSWFSLVGGVSWPKVDVSGAQWWEHPRERIVVQDLCLDETEKVMTMRGKLLSMMQRLEQLHLGEGACYYLDLNWDADPRTTGVISGKDADGKAMLLVDVWCLVVFAPDGRASSKVDDEGFGLLLTKGRGPGTYKRIGFADVIISDDYERYQALWDSIDLSSIVLE